MNNDICFGEAKKLCGFVTVPQNVIQREVGVHGWVNKAPDLDIGDF